MNVKDLLNLEGKVALITGGSRGIGLQMGEALGEMGAKLALSARKPAELAQAKAHFEALGIECLTVANDLSDFASIPGLADTVIGHYGQVDILINNAGCSWGAPAEDHTDAAWHKVMNLDISAQFFLSREIGKRSMIPRQGGKIINIASIAGLGGNPPNWGMDTISYNTAKGAMVNFTRALAAEWGKYNIQVNAICPGFFPTKMSQGLLDVIEEKYVRQTPAHRLGNEHDLKGLTLVLASRASDYMSGQAIAVDGGFSVT
jgi:NAD(P)-dependent dehydrogenase (short-subunit alcohol dehydrogenase family)